MAKNQKSEISEECEKNEPTNGKMLAADAVVEVFEVEVAERKVYRFTAPNRKAAIAIMKDDVDVIISGEISDYQHKVMERSLKSVGYMLKN